METLLYLQPNNQQTIHQLLSSWQKQETV